MAPSRWRGAALCAALLAALACSAARANDRPFLLTSNAAAEEDDDNVWAIETWWQRAGQQQVLTLAPEYAFNPTTSIQFEFSHSRVKGIDDDGATTVAYGSTLELEFKHLFNHIARDGWGWGLDLSVDAAGTAGDEGSGWRWQGLTLKLPYSLQLRDGDALLHLNAGLQKQRGERREWVGSVAIEHKLPWRTSTFVELGREDRRTLWHAGVRHWIQRDKIALDLSVQQLRGAGEKASGVVIGLAWYDL